MRMFSVCPVFRCLLVTVVLATLVACGNGRSGGGGGLPVPGGTVTDVARFGFSANRGDNTLSTYLIDSATGQWRHHGYVLTSSAPVAVAVTPNERFVYVVNTAAGSVSMFSLAAGSGQLTAIGTGTIAAGTNPSDIVVTPAGSFAYVANTGSDSVSGYSINPTTGALTGPATTGLPAGSAPLALVVHPTRPFLYVINSGATGEISAFSFNTTTGVLSAVAGPPAVIGTGLQDAVIDPSGKFLYVVRSGGNNTISAFGIDAVSGALTATGPALPTGSDPRSVAVHASGRFVFVANYAANTISTFTVDPVSGVLTSAGAALPTVAAPRSLRADPSGNYLFVAGETGRIVTGYRVNTTSGALSPLGSTRTRSLPYALAISAGSPLAPQPRFAYVSNSFDSTVGVYTVNTTSGALTSRSTATAGLFPVSIAVDPFGRFAFAAGNDINGNGRLRAYTINSSNNGALTVIDADTAPDQQDYSVGNNPQRIVVDPSGWFVYVSCNVNPGSAGEIRAFRINASNGRLTAINGSPFVTGADPIGLVVDPTGQYLYAVNKTTTQTTGTLSAFSINPASGALAGVGSTVAAGAWPEPITVDPSGHFAYVGNRGSNTLTRYTIALGGALTSLGTMATEAGPAALAIDPLGRYLYAAADNARLAGYAVNSSNGNLVSVGTPTGLMASPATAVVDPSGRFVYLSYSNDTFVSVYGIRASTGALTAAGTTNTGGLGFPLALAITTQLQ